MNSAETRIWQSLEKVMDPEIPTISVVDLGIVTKVYAPGPDTAEVVLTPTFSGCPALKIMEELVAEQLHKDGFTEVKVSTSFETTWTSDLITPKGLEALQKHGLAAPPKTHGYIELDVLSDVACPFCGSRNTTLKSPFGATLCRAIHYCNNCLQGFEQFKPV